MSDYSIVGYVSRDPVVVRNGMFYVVCVRLSVALLREMEMVGGQLSPCAAPGE